MFHFHQVLMIISLKNFCLKRNHFNYIKIYQLRLSYYLNSIVPTSLLELSKYYFTKWTLSKIMSYWYFAKPKAINCNIFPINNLFWLTLNLFFFNIVLVYIINIYLYIALRIYLWFFNLCGVTFSLTLRPVGYFIILLLWFSVFVLIRMSCHLIRTFGWLGMLPYWGLSLILVLFIIVCFILIIVFKLSSMFILFE